MYYFTPDVIAQANNQINSLDAKVGGLFCILHCLNERVEDNISYTIDGDKLRRQLSTVFDREPKDSYKGMKPSYIIFAKEWITTFFGRYIKNKIDLLACAVFFLRRNGFEIEATEEEVIDTFIKRFNLQQYKQQWFYEGGKITLSYNQNEVEDNQTLFYSKMNYTNDFKSILFDGVIQKSAADLKAAGQIQTLYSGSGVQTCFLLSDEPLDKYYIMSNEDNEVTDEHNKDYVDLKVADNILLYGVPGCGKSHEIKENYCDDDDYMERAVFHPDYTYSDFVGQILPKIETDEHGNKRVSYEFEAGPFTKILRKAVQPENKASFFYLIIEEINRGNAPAIFGDIFQLLDRDDDGESEYGISNDSIADYVYGDKTKKVKLPSNLYILATMNTSDQNVFTLDTAFKRRWSMKRIENNIDGCKYGTHKVCNTGVEWRVFAKTVNDLIIDISTENLSNEDNRLGAYFVKESELDDADKFGEKVLMYLWNDAFKYDHDKVFKAKYHTLDELIDGFKTDGLNVFEKADLFVKTPIGDAVIEGRQVDVDRYLEGKKDYLIAYYKGLLEAVKSRVPETKDTSTGSLQYAAWRSDNISKSSFADVYLQSDKMVVFTEIPKKPKSIGEELENDGHKNHYYRIEYSEDMISEIVEIIVESYEQLKKGDANA